jgi:hypothetical protein
MLSSGKEQSQQQNVAKEVDVPKKTHVPTQEESITGMDLPVFNLDGSRFRVNEETLRATILEEQKLLKSESVTKQFDPSNRVDR